jgi:hypothetical protein
MMHANRVIAISKAEPKEKKQVGDHAFPQEGCGLDNPEGVEGGWTTPGNTGRERQRERSQATVHHTSKHTFTSRHGRVSDRSPNHGTFAKGHNRQELCRQQHKQSGDKRTRSRKGLCPRSFCMPRLQEQRHANAVDIRRVKRVNMQCLVHPRGRNSVTRQKIQEIKPQILRIRAIRRGSLAAEKEMLDAAPAAFHQGVPPSSICGGRLMQTWQAEQAQSPCNGRESQSTQGQKGRWPERTQRKVYTSGAGNSARSREARRSCQRAGVRDQA